MNTRRGAKIGVVLTVIASLILAYRVGVFHQFSEPAQVANVLVALGPWGYLVFIAAYAALQPFGIPGTVFIIAAPLIWPWPIAFALSMTGSMAASVVGFSFARFVGGGALAKKIPVRFQHYNDALASRAFTTVFLLRLALWMSPFLHAFFGLSKVRFWTHFWGSFAGYLLPVFLVSFFGQKVFDAMKNAPPRMWILVGVSTLLVAASVWMIKRRRRSGSARQSNVAVVDVTEVP